MKMRIYVGAVMGMLAVALTTRAADTLTQSLQHGLFEEEANQNLDAAIKDYQSVISQGEEQRKVIATALFRLGECYRKLGKTNDANAQYLDASGLSLTEVKINDACKNNYSLVMARRTLGSMTPVLVKVYAADKTTVLCPDYDPTLFKCN